MSKIYTKIISRCDECPLHYVDERCGSYVCLFDSTRKTICFITNETKRAGVEFPDWCQLKENVK